MKWLCVMASAVFCAFRAGMTVCINLKRNIFDHYDQTERIPAAKETLVANDG